MNYTELKKYLDNGGDPNAYNHDGWSMLFNYITRLDCFELLLERGANPNQSYFKDKETFQQATKHQKGAIIGSAFINFLKKNPISMISKFVHKIKQI